MELQIITWKNPYFQFYFKESFKVFDDIWLFLLSKELIYLKDLDLFITDLITTRQLIFGLGNKLKQGKYNLKLIKNENINGVKFKNYERIEENLDYHIYKKIEDKVFYKDDYFYIDIVLYKSFGELIENYLTVYIY
ncbi:MAG: hypothetical protein ACPL1F_01470 [bacterium]